MRLQANFIFTAFFLLIQVFLNAQENISKDGEDFFQEQLEVYPQEKIHLHTDKSYYLSGEKIWFQTYLVNSSSHQLESISKYIYVELINPLDSVINRIKIITDSTHAGYIQLYEELPEGNYYLRAYTYPMNNLGDNFFYKKNIRIASPFSADMQTHISFSFTDNDNVSARIFFTDKKNNSKLRFDHFRMRINAGPIEQKIFKKDAEAYVSFPLPEDSKYRIMYIETNEYRQFIHVPYPQDDYNVSFFPEGGYALEGTLTKFGFKAININGLSENITGEIRDDNGTLIQEISTLGKGMGAFSFIPEKGKEYHAVCKNDKNIVQEFKLPRAYPNTYSLHTNWKDDKLYVFVTKSEGAELPEQLYLFIHTRGIPQYMEEWNKNKNYLILDKYMFPSGVSQILLLDENMNPLSERLFFCINEDQADVSFTTDKECYGTREKVETAFKITDDEDIPVQGILSFAVTDDNFALPDSSSTILSTLLLTSELKGFIEEPASYFYKGDTDAQAELDILMMTQGWRRYNIPEVLKGNIEESKFTEDTGQQISGSVHAANGDAVVGANVSLMSLNHGNGHVTTTDDNGHFIFDAFDSPENTVYVAQALTDKGDSDVKLNINNDDYPKLEHPMPVPEYINPRFFEQFIEKADQRFVAENGMRMIYLKEVIIKGKRNANSKSIFSNLATNIFTTEQIAEAGFLSVEEVLTRVPGFMVIGDDIRLSAGLSEKDPNPQLYIDGMLMNQMGDLHKTKMTLEQPEQYRQPGEPEWVTLRQASAPNAQHKASIRQYLDMVEINNIERIEVFKGASAIVAGGKDGGGVINIITKDGSKGIERRYSNNMKEIYPLGFQQPIEFYSPKYETDAQRNNKEYDLRTTIFWMPELETDGQGEAKANFYTADIPSSYSIVIEGITRDGKIIRQTAKIINK